jgi:hypothetical protein
MVDEVLPDEHSRFDSFPEADFIREEVALNRIGEYPPDRCDLVLKEFDGGRDEAGKATEGSSLFCDVAEERRPSVEEERCLENSVREEVSRLLDRVAPARVKRGDRDAYVRLIRQADVVVILRSADRRCRDEASVHASDTPCPVSVGEEHPRLRGQFDRVDLGGRHRDALKIRAHGRGEVLDDGVIAAKFD